MSPKSPHRLQRLTRDEVRAAIRFKHPARPAVARALTVEPELMARYGRRITELQEQYPDDISFTNVHVEYWESSTDDPGYRWAFGNKQKPPHVPLDDCPVIADWSELDQFLAEMPSPQAAEPVRKVEQLLRQNPDDYILVSFGHYFNQKFASLRGMQNLLMDVYDHQEYLHRLSEAMLDYYRVLAERVAAAGANGVYGGEDLGMQTALFMSPDIFRGIYKPYYKAFADILHHHGLDFWMHSCGNITEIMPDLIECGIDVLHPIQVGTMDDRQIVADYSGQIAFHVGMDVQHLIPFGTPDEIRCGILERAQLFYRPEGGVIFAAGNVITADTPIENIEAYAGALFEFLAQCDSKLHASND